MYEKSTTDLLNILTDIDSDSKMNDFLDSHTGLSGISEYFKNYFDSHDLKQSEVQKIFSGYYERSHFYKVIGEKRVPSRDVVLIICLASRMNLKDTRRTLSHFGLANLYPRIARDAIIATNINRGNFSIDNINEQLAAHSEPVLGHL